MRKHVASVLCGVFLFLSMKTFAGGVDLDVRDVTTQYGINYWYVHENSLPIVSVSMAFKHAGSLYDPDGKKGLASLAASLVLRGTTKDGENIGRRLREQGVALGISVDKDNLYIRLKALAENLDFALSMIGYSLVKAPVEDVSFLTEKELQKAVIRRNVGDPAELADGMLSKILFGDSPHAYQIEGSVETVDRITLGDINDYRNISFDLDKMVVSVVGDVSSEAVSSMLDMYFSGLARGQNKRVVDKAVPNIGLRGYVHHEAPQSVIVFAANGISRKDDNYPLAEVLSNAIGRGNSLTSVLMRELRGKRGITYRVMASMQHMEGVDLFSGLLYTDGSTAEEGVEALLETIESVKTNGLDKSTFNVAIANIVNSFTYAFLDTASAAATLTDLQMLGFDTDYIKEHGNKYRSITLQDVNKFAKSFLGDFTIVEVGETSHIGATVLS